MLRQDDERAIEDLFERLANVERVSGPRDRDAEALIFQKLRENPAAAYYLAQTVVVQEAALRDQQARIERLESKDRGFLDEIFGDDRPAPRREQQPPPQPAQQRPSPWGQPQPGGFLAGAAQTALGVTGGMLLGSAIAGMFGGGSAHAGEADLGADTSLDEGGLDEGGDFGSDWGDFDIGGEF